MNMKLCIIIYISLFLIWIVSIWQNNYRIAIIYKTIRIATVIIL